MRRAPAETMLFADLHALHVDLNAVERDARVLLERERDLVDEVLGNGADAGGQPYAWTGRGRASG